MQDNTIDIDVNFVIKGRTRLVADVRVPEEAYNVLSVITTLSEDERSLNVRAVLQPHYTNGLCAYVDRKIHLRQIDGFWEGQMIGTFVRPGKAAYAIVID